MTGSRMRRLAQKLLIVVLLGSSLVASFAVVQGQQQGITRSSAALQPQKLPEFTRRGKHGLSNVLSLRRGGSSATQLQSTGAFVVLNAFWKANPLIAAAAVCATKSTLADIVAQRRQQQQQQVNSTSGGAFKLDSRRTLSFMIYGALYQGMVQELIYNNVYTFLFGSATTARVVAKKVLFDAFFHNALVCIPMAYAVKAFVFQYSLVTGIRQYIDDVRHHGLLLKYYAIWMPVNAMIFTIVPTHWRITVMAVVSFFWMIVLSTISSRSRET